MIDCDIENRYTNTSFAHGLVLQDAEGLVIDLDTLTEIKVDLDFEDDRTLIKWEWPTVTNRKAIEITDAATGLMTIFIDASDTELISRQDIAYVTVRYEVVDADYESGTESIECDKTKVFNLLKSRS